jgi:hypothetical protein
MTVDFKVYLQLKLVKAWNSFFASLSNPTEFMKTILTKLMLKEDDISINITRFQCAWTHLKGSLSNLLIPSVLKIDQILQIWEDYLLIDLRLEELDQ